MSESPLWPSSRKSRNRASLHRETTLQLETLEERAYLASNVFEAPLLVDGIQTIDCVGTERQSKPSSFVATDTNSADSDIESFVSDAKECEFTSHDEPKSPNEEFIDSQIVNGTSAELIVDEEDTDESSEHDTEELELETSIPLPDPFLPENPAARDPITLPDEAAFSEPGSIESPLSRQGHGQGEQPYGHEAKLPPILVNPSVLPVQQIPLPLTTINTPNQIQIQLYDITELKYSSRSTVAPTCDVESNNPRALKAETLSFLVSALQKTAQRRLVQPTSPQVIAASSLMPIVELSPRKGVGQKRAETELSESTKVMDRSGMHEYPEGNASVAKEDDQASPPLASWQPSGDPANVAVIGNTEPNLELESSPDSSTPAHSSSPSILQLQPETRTSTLAMLALVGLFYFPSAMKNRWFSKARLRDIRNGIEPIRLEPVADKLSPRE